jgi:Zn-dependent protease
MPTDPLTWSPINLGRWFGVQVRVHIFLVIFAAVALLGAAIGSHRVAQTAGWLGLLVLALAAHELGHAAMAAWLGCEPEEVRLWPLGNMVGPAPSGRSNDNILVALAGPAASAAMVLAAAVALNALNAQFVWYPFGNPDDSGAPMVLGADKKFAPAVAFSAAWWVGWFGYLNWVIMLANLLPALPFDGGRVLRAYLAHTSVATARDSMIAPYMARGWGIVLFASGLIRLLVWGKGDGLTLVGLAILIEWMVRAEARVLEDGGFFDDGVFGYDFSEGYTSLEAGTAKVRPYRESALRRWRRRRSELRRQRRAAREAAEERRMDEILEKLHREGRPALTDEEHRFLVRVSAKYRNRPRAHD